MMDDMLKIVNEGIKTMLYGITLSEILDHFGVDTSYDPPMSHALFNLIKECTFNKLRFVFKNNQWVRKEIVDELVLANDDVDEGQPSIDLSGSICAQPSTYPDCPSSTLLEASTSSLPPSTTFNIERAFSWLLSFMETMDSRWLVIWMLLKCTVMKCCRLNKILRMSSTSTFHHSPRLLWETSFHASCNFCYIS